MRKLFNISSGNSILAKRIRKFKSIKRAYYSLIILIFMYIISLLGPVLVNNKALVVKYENNYKGVNSRLDELQAAILRVKLKNLDKDNSLRQQHAKKYNELLKDLPIELPKKRKSCTHVSHLFVIKAEKIRNL